MLHFWVPVHTVTSRGVPAGLQNEIVCASLQNSAYGVQICRCSRSIGVDDPSVTRMRTEMSVGDFIFVSLLGLRKIGSC